MHAVCATPWPWRSSCASHFRGWLPCVKIQVVLLLCKCDCLVVLCCYVFVFPTRRIAKLCIAKNITLANATAKKWRCGFIIGSYRMVSDAYVPPTRISREIVGAFFVWRLFAFARVCRGAFVQALLCSTCSSKYICGV